MVILFFHSRRSSTIASGYHFEYKPNTKTLLHTEVCVSGLWETLFLEAVNVLQAIDNHSVVDELNITQPEQPSPVPCGYREQISSCVCKPRGFLCSFTKLACYLPAISSQSVHCSAWYIHDVGEPISQCIQWSLNVCSKVHWIWLHFKCPLVCRRHPGVLKAPIWMFEMNTGLLFILPQSMECTYNKGGQNKKKMELGLNHPHHVI